MKCVEFSKSSIAEKDSFNDVTWTDESTIQLVRYARSIRIKMGKEPN